MKERIRSIQYILDKQIFWISLADSKTTPIFTIATFLLGTMAALTPKIAEWDYILIFSGFICTFSLLCCLIFVFLTIFSRTFISDKSIIYFGAIVKNEKKYFINELENFEEKTYFKDLTEQCYRNAEIAYIKHRYLKLAIIMLYTSVLPWVFFLWKSLSFLHEKN